MASLSETGWYVAAGEGPPMGPYDVTQLAAHYAGGYITPETPLWCEGQPAWLKLSEIPLLAQSVQLQQQQAAAAASAGPATRLGAVIGAAPVINSRAADSDAAEASKPAAADDTPELPDDPLAAFKAEIQALEGDGDGQKDGQAAKVALPDELSFVDDDGTLYKWDTTLNKYVAEGGPEDCSATPGAAAGDQHAAAAAAAAAAAPDGASEYDWQMMTFAVEDEVIPSLQAAKAAALGVEPVAGTSDAAAAGGGKGGKGGAKRGAAATAAAAADVGPSDSVDAAAGVERSGDAAAASEDPPGSSGPAEIIAGGGKRQKKGAKNPEQQAQEQAWFDLKQNTSVYVTGLPDDATPAEVCNVFSKCGLIKEDDQHQPRIKLYRDPKTQMLKGDGLVTYLKEPSVLLATQILDGAQFRDGVGKPMTVTRAKFEMKGDAYMPKARTGKREKKQVLQKIEKSLGWGGFDDKLSADKVTVVLKHMFTQDELIDNMMLAEEIEHDVTAECSKMGTLEKVRVFKSNPEGVVTVRFKEQEPAHKCVAAMNGRWFAGRQLVAHLYDGITNYHVKVQESAEEQAARLEAYTRELEAQQLAKLAREEEQAAAAAAATTTAHSNGETVGQGDAANGLAEEPGAPAQHCGTAGGQDLGAACGATAADSDMQDVA